MAKKSRPHAPANEGKGYGTSRFLLFKAARNRIELCLCSGFFCESIAITESVIADRLESRLCWLKSPDIGFETLGFLISNLRRCETDPELIGLLGEIDDWREDRNRVIHEIVKVETGKPYADWNSRMADAADVACAGYELLKRLYHRVADLNPNHPDRVFGYPKSSLQDRPRFK